jgi:HD superfamily phosphohydrolase
MSSWPKIIRDPVHNLISFDETHCDRLLLELINTSEFQRLRRIKQLGFSQLTFPGADHSRFAHSIGVMHIARQMLTRIATVCPACADDDQRMVVLAAALLHDVGHGPFSHAFEKATGDKHEARTIEIISSEHTEINKTLRRAANDLPDRLRVFFDESLEDPSNALPSPYLTQIVSSQLDADRFDYLLRDSHATGSESGRFDLDWLIQHLEVDRDKGRFFLQSKALFAAEAYIFARYHMYRTVYYHKTTRAAEVMLRMLLRRYKELLGKAESDREKLALVPGAPPAMAMAFSTKLGLAEYLMLDDHTMTEFAKACRRCDDSVLSTLAAGLLDRKLFKGVDVTDAESPKVAKFYERAKAIVAEKSGLPVDYSFDVDSPSDTPYKQYSPNVAKPATQIFVATADGTQSELFSLSENVRNLTKPFTLDRYYFPESVRDIIQTDAVPLLFKE